MRLLFFGQSYSPFQSCIEAAVSGNLRLQGHSVVNVICAPRAFHLCDVFHVDTKPGMRDLQCSGPCTSLQEKLLKSVGVDPFPISSFWTPVDVDHSQLWAVRESIHEDLRKVQYKGYPLFEIAKWGIYRYLRQVDSTEPNGKDRWIFTETMKNARLAVDVCERLLDQCEFDRVVLWNGLKVMARAMFEAARRRGIPVVCLEHGLLNNTAIFSQNAFAVPQDYSREWEEWKDVPLDPQEESWIVDYLRSRETTRDFPNTYGREHALEWSQLREELEIPQGAKLVSFLPGIKADSSMEGVGYLFADMADWIRQAAVFFERFPDHIMAVRIHPAEVAGAEHLSREPFFDYIRAMKLPKNFRVIRSESKLDSYSLGKHSAFIAPFVSTLGLEMACWGKPVIPAARTHYQKKGFTWDASTKEEYFGILERMCREPIAPPGAQEKAIRYAYLYFQRTSLPLDFMTEPSHGAGTPLWSTIEDLAPGRFPQLDHLVRSVLGETPFAPPPPQSRQRGSHSLQSAEARIPFNIDCP